jgi:uncharacterized protein DUF955
VNDKIGPPDPSHSCDGAKPEPWLPAVREFVESRQERAYRRLGIQLGLGADAAKAYAHLVRPQIPLPHVSSKKWEEQFGTKLTAKEAQIFDQAFADYYDYYFSRETPTPFEDPNYHPVMMILFEQALEAFAATGRTFSPRPFLATLPSGQVNAHIVVEEETQTPVIFFEQGLFQLLGDFAFLVGRATPTLSMAELRDDAALARHRGPHMIPFQASELFVNALGSYVISGTPTAAQNRIPKPTQNMALSMTLINQMRTFAMAHELAHIALGHLDRSTTDKNESWAREYQADALALFVLTEAARTNGLSWGVVFWACELTLGCFDLLDRAIAWMQFGDQAGWISNTHPDSFSRSRRLREIITIGNIGRSGWSMLWHLFKRSMASLGFGSVPNFALTRRPPIGELECLLGAHVSAKGFASATEACSMTDAILRKLWMFTLGALARERARGTRPSPLWKKRIDSCFQSP